MRIRSQTVCDSRFSEEKQKVNKGERDQNLAFILVILMRIPPYFLSKSRVLHLVCTPTGVYSRKGGPRSSHVLLFQNIFMSTIMNGDGNYACALLKNFNFKRSDAIS